MAEGYSVLLKMLAQELNGLSREASRIYVYIEHVLREVKKYIVYHIVINNLKTENG